MRKNYQGGLIRYNWNKKSRGRYRHAAPIAAHYAKDAIGQIKAVCQISDEGQEHIKIERRQSR